jgi:hypothetical protein
LENLENYKNRLEFMVWAWVEAVACRSPNPDTSSTAVINDFSD